VNAELKRWLPILALVALLNIPFLHLALTGPAPVTAQLPFEDTFDRADLGPAWSSLGGAWRIVDGAVHAPGVRNNPLWLQAALPRDVVVEFDVRSLAPDGDIKFEIFADGVRHASGYVCIFGGWKNTASVLARLDEHGRDRKERRDRKVERGRTYRMRVERRGSKLSWFIDNEPFLEWDDSAPLYGEGHDRFGFSAWEVDLLFDNLRVEAI